MDAKAHFDVQREWYERYARIVLEESQPITAESVDTIELVLMEAEVDAAKGALRNLGPPKHSGKESYFVRQEGTTCMSTSVANGMISLNEPFLISDPERRVPLLTSDIVDRTSAFGKPGEYRSVDDMFKYLEDERLLDVKDGDETFSSDYTVRLTNSLLDVCECLWTGLGRLVVQRSAHAHLGFGLELEDDQIHVLFRDPMTRSGSSFSRLSLKTLRQDYLWSPLKKIPRLMGPFGFSSLTAEDLIGHLERYDAMENLGVDCPSALLFRKPQAPPLRGPADEDEVKKETVSSEA